jgi:hypothetical protein
MLFVQIQGFKKLTTDSQPSDQFTIGSFELSDVQPKALPPLAVLSISDSSFLRRLYLMFYCAMVAAIWVAFAPYWVDSNTGLVKSILYLCIAILSSGWLVHLYLRQKAAIPVGLLAYQATSGGHSGVEDGVEEGCWIFTGSGGDVKYQLAGEVLCWPWLIMLPLKNQAGVIKNVFIAMDALDARDQARLRTWLRACLKPKS